MFCALQVFWGLVFRNLDQVSQAVIVLPPVHQADITLISVFHESSSISNAPILPESAFAWFIFMQRIDHHGSGS